MTEYQPIKINCFKAYDIRGKLGSELNVDIAYRIGRAFGQHLKPKSVVVGGDIRLTSAELKNALADGLRDAGVDVIDLGQTGTEEIYFATSYLELDGGVEVTASHNPMDYNGLKLVSKGSRPISGDTGLLDIKALAESGKFIEVKTKGSLTHTSVMDAYIQHLLGYIDAGNIKPMKLVVNAGNGAAGAVIDALEQKFKQLKIPLEFIKIHHQPDGNFPNGIPNPLLPENRQATIDAVLAHKADLGIAWDGDFDRCFLFDETGKFIEGYYIVGLLAEAFLQKNAGAKIIHDPRLVWNTIEKVEQAGGEAIQSRTGHAFIKQLMREKDAVYGGEMSAHHYFKQFFYCDSGMIPWLLIVELLCVKSATLSSQVKDAMAAYPSPGEINRTVDDADMVVEKIMHIYQADALNIDHTDGISVDMGQWRFSLRKSNTEPLIRLNLETRGDRKLMKIKTAELLALIEG
ncbi:MAG: phosphomannomutase CpsG [Rhizobiales bacterium]|nr:phosphomannomutase CpsG [Hyphomicrobiales bacterium]NRB13165.1 phosphomannomutase CpsG [Hyphomicrobiales bacterium]